jgi:DNA-directed RNA polymerase subunit alpha
MLVKFGKTEKPRKIVIEDETATPTFARFIAEPLERVLGHSIGNALRRSLLSSLEAPGIMSIKFEGVAHEYTPIEGFSEDVTHIILNLKGAKLRCLPSQETSTTREPRIYSSTIDVTQHDLDKNGGFVDICLKDLVQNSVFDIVNPDLKICTVTKPTKKQVDLRIGYGKGYVTSERHTIPNKLVDEIVIDTAFSPVTLVNYFVENTRVGQDTDFDRLVLEVTTDGRLSPAEAISFAAQVLMVNFEVFKELKDHELVFEALSKDSQADDDELLDKLVLRIDEIELSVRSTNCLKNADIGTIAELACIPEKNMLEFRNFGKKSLNEIKAKLADMGLSLGMDLSEFGIIPESPDIKEKVKDLIEQRKQKKEKKKKV